MYLKNSKGDTVPHFIIWQALIWARFTLVSPFLFLLTMMILYTLGFRDWALFFDTILNNFKGKTEILMIKKIPKDFCMGYFCKNGHTKKEITVAYIKFYRILNAKYKYNGKLLTPINSSDPFGLIVDNIDNIKVGDYINIYSSNIKRK
jgi:hypothetical protein